MAFGGAFRRPQSLSNTSREFGSSQSGTEIPEFRQAVAESRSHILKKRESDLAADFHQLKLQSEVVGPHGQSEVVGSHGQSATVLHLTAEVSRSHDVTAVLQGESAASIRCEDIQWVFQMINEHMETSYLYRLEYDSLLGFTIGKDFGTAYAMLRPLWRCFEGHGVLGTAQKEMDNWRAFLHARRKGAIHRDKIGVTMIIDPYQIPPRRVWDLYANRVVDYAYCSFTGSNGWESFVNDQVVSSAGRKLCAISHAWTDDTQTIMTPINGGQWPVTIPVGVDLESIRREVLALGVQYCWLDVLCLRQGFPRGTEGLRLIRQRTTTLSTNDRPLSAAGARKAKRVEWDLRKEEWRIDVPTIGNVYREKADTFVLRYYNGLGRCFDNNPALLDGKRHWKNRVWTVQESTGNYMVGGRREKGQDIERDFLQLAVECVMHPHTMNCFIKERDRLFYALLLIHGRQATNEIDKITSISYILRCPTLPAYDIDEKPEDAWGLCISHMPRWGRGELLFRYPVPSDQQESQRRWCPSWEHTKSLRLVEWSATGSKLQQSSEIEGHMIPGRSFDSSSYDTMFDHVAVNRNEAGKATSAICIGYYIRTCSISGFNTVSGDDEGSGNNDICKANPTEKPTIYGKATGYKRRTSFDLMTTKTGKPPRFNMATETEKPTRFNITLETEKPTWFNMTPETEKSWNYEKLTRPEMPPTRFKRPWSTDMRPWSTDITTETEKPSGYEKRRRLNKTTGFEMITGNQMPRWKDMAMETWGPMRIERTAETKKTTKTKKTTEAEEESWCRYGKIVVDGHGMQRREWKIFADHMAPIPDGDYSLVGCRHGGCWVVCEAGRTLDEMLKVSVICMPSHVGRDLYRMGLVASGVEITFL